MNDARWKWSAVMTTTGVRLLLIAAGLGTSVLTVRALGVEGRGVYYGATTVAGIVAQFSNLGLTSSNTFLAAKSADATQRLLANSVWVAITCWIAGLLLVGLGGQGLALLLHLRPRTLMITATLAPCILFTTLGSSLLVAHERFRAVNGWQVFNAAAAIILLLACAWLKLDATGFLLAITVSAIATASGVWASLRGNAPMRWRFNGDLFREGFSFAARAYVAVLAGFLMQRTGATILLAVGDLHSLGILSISTQVYDVLMILPSSMGMVLFPSLIKRQEEAWRATRRALLVTMLLMGLACGAAWAFGGFLLPLVFGVRFRESYGPMLALLPAVICMSAVSVVSQYLVFRKFPTRLVFVWTAGFLITLASAAGLRPWYGVCGVAFAQSIGSLAVLVGVTGLAVEQVLRDSRSAQK